jgi:hypothetical protein
MQSLSSTQLRFVPHSSQSCSIGDRSTNHGPAESRLKIAGEEDEGSDRRQAEEEAEGDLRATLSHHDRIIGFGHPRTVVLQVKANAKGRPFRAGLHIRGGNGGYFLNSNAADLATPPAVRVMVLHELA